MSKTRLQIEDVYFGNRNFRGNDMRSGYVWYIPVIQADVPACTTFIEMYVQNNVHLLCAASKQPIMSSNLCVKHTKQTEHTEVCERTRTD